MTEKNGTPGLASLIKKASRPMPDDPDAWEHHPLLTELLFPTYGDDGKLQREGASLTIRSIGSDYMVAINCPTEQVSVQMILPSLIEILVNVEESLRTGRYTYDTSFGEKKRARQKLARRIV